MDYIQVRNLTKSFGKNVIINDISFNFQKGKCYGIVGKNGCGKSVLFKLLSGLMIPNSGDIIVDDISIGKNGNLCKDIGILIEHPGFLPDHTGYQNLKLLADINKKVDDKRINEIFKIISLENAKDTKVKHYSLGMLQRLAIGQAIMEYPKFLILDEPFNSLDEESVENLRDIILNYCKNNEVTTLIASHNKEDINYLTDYIIKLENGKFIEI